MGTFASSLFSRRVLLLALSGILTALAFPTTAVPWVIFVSLLPLFRECYTYYSIKKSFFTGFLWGLFFFSTLNYWLIVCIHTFGGLPLPVALAVFALLVLYLSCFSGVFALCLSLLFSPLRQKDLTPGTKTLLPCISLMAASSALWVLITEELRGCLFSGYPWGALGYSLTDNLPQAQLASVLSVYGLSFLIVFINGLCFLSLFLFMKKRETQTIPSSLPFAPLLLAGVILLSNHLWGLKQMENLHQKTAAGSSASVALLQGNIPQDEKWSRAFKEKTMNTYLKLQEEAIRKGAKFILWPETAIPLYLEGNDYYLSLLAAIAEQEHIGIATGAPNYILDKEDEKGNLFVTNSAYFFPPRLQNPFHPQRYDKIHLVPFGEYVPFGSWLPFVDKLVAEVGNFLPGTEHSTFRLKQENKEIIATPFICFEVLFPDEVRRGVQQETNLLLHLTNDAWFGRTKAAWQHMGIVQLRAIENHITAITAANTGISSIILPTGEIAQESALFTEAVITARIPLLKEMTPYKEYGAPLRWILFGIVLTAGTGGFLTLRKRRS